MEWNKWSQETVVTKTVMGSEDIPSYHFLTSQPFTNDCRVTEPSMIKTMKRLKRLQRNTLDRLKTNKSTDYRRNSKVTSIFVNTLGVYVSKQHDLTINSLVSVVFVQLLFTCVSTDYTWLTWWRVLHEDKIHKPLGVHVLCCKSRDKSRTALHNLSHTPAPPSSHPHPHPHPVSPHV